MPYGREGTTIQASKVINCDKLHDVVISKAFKPESVIAQ
jgi:hypothetical protein